MVINLKYEGFALRDDIRLVIDDKLSKDIDKYLSRYPEDKKKAVMTLDKVDYYFVVKFDLWLPRKKHIFAQEENKDLLTAIYKVRDEVVRQLQKN